MLVALFITKKRLITHKLYIIQSKLNIIFLRKKYSQVKLNLDWLVYHQTRLHKLDSSSRETQFQNSSSSSRFGQALLCSAWLIYTSSFWSMIYCNMNSASKKKAFLIYKRNSNPTKNLGFFCCRNFKGGPVSSIKPTQFYATYIALKWS